MTPMGAKTTTHSVTVSPPENSNPTLDSLKSLYSGPITIAVQATSTIEALRMARAMLPWKLHPWTFDMSAGVR